MLTRKLGSTGLTVSALGFGAGHIDHLCRHAVILWTKVGCDVAGEDDWSAGAVCGGVERALRELRTDVLDVDFLHSCDLTVLEQGDVAGAPRLS